MAEELELAPDDGVAAEPDDGAALELEELEGCCVVEPAPAEPLMLEEPEAGAELEEPDAGAVLDEDEEAPPLALSFLLTSIEVDDELEPDGAAVEPDGAVELDEDAPAGARLLSARSQPVRTAAPNARETASARVETFMWPPWLGY